MGRALILSLSERSSEFRITATARRGTSFKNSKAEIFYIENPEDTPDYSEALKGCETVVHCATLSVLRQGQGWIDQSMYRRVNVQGTIHLARQAYLAGVRRFIFLSTVHVNGEVTPIRKKFFPDSVARPKHAYGISMLTAEKELLKLGSETGMEITIVRTPEVYGPAGRGFCNAIRTMVKYCLPLPLYLADKNQRSLIYIGNLTNFIESCIARTEAAGEIFLVSDGVTLSTKEIFQLYALTGHRPCLLWPFPIALLRLFNSYIGRQAWEDFAFESQVVDIGKAKTLLGWTPPIPAEEGFRRSWEQELSSGCLLSGAGSQGAAEDAV